MAGKYHANITMSWTSVSCSTWPRLVCESLFYFQAGEGSSSTHIDPSVLVTSTLTALGYGLSLYYRQISLINLLVFLTDGRGRKVILLLTSAALTAYKPKVHGG